MSEVKVEMIMDGKVKFDTNLDYQTVQLMMQSDFVTISSNTIRVEMREVTSDGVVRFMGSKASLNRLI